MGAEWGSGCTEDTPEIGAASELVLVKSLLSLVRGVTGTARGHFEGFVPR